MDRPELVSYGSVASLGSTSTTPTPPPQRQSPATQLQLNNNNAPKYGTLVPNRIFVGGIAMSTTDDDLTQLFGAHGSIKSAKVIVDRAGVSKGYGFVTFVNECDAKKLMLNSDHLTLNQRRLNIAPAIKKQPFTNRTFESPPSSMSLSYPPQIQYYNNPQVQSQSFANSLNNSVGGQYSYYQIQQQQPAMQANDIGANAYTQTFGLQAALPTTASQPVPMNGYHMMYPHPPQSMYITQAATQQYQAYPPLNQSPAWVDPALSAQYQIAPTLPYLVPMY